ncbi:MAG: 2-oxoisovalerate dehydrogenase [Nitrospinae bacterium]|nr:2-oxoisovalerate dehydrogenase [Nitrospinota bacterium]
MKKEIIFQVEEDAEGGFIAKATGYAIFTQADSIEDLKKNVREAVDCHFEDDEKPSLIEILFQ